jgi:small subunit ribosomal protein S16
MRVGKKKQPTYRIVAADSRSPRDGRFIEIVGTYQPRAEPSVITVKNDKVLEWLAKGAQPTERVQKLLEISGVWSEFEASKPAKKAARVRPSRAGAAKKVKVKAEA